MFQVQEQRQSEDANSSQNKVDLSASVQYHFHGWLTGPRSGYHLNLVCGYDAENR